MRHIIALIIAITIFTGAQTANAEGGKTIGTLAGATIGSLTFKNKISGAAIGAGVGLLVGAIVDSEMDRYSRQEVRQVRNRPAPRRTVTVIEERPVERVIVIKERPAKRVVKKHHRKNHRKNYRNKHRFERRPIRERTVKTRLPNGRVKVVQTTIYR